MRELRNAMERAVIVWPADTLEPAAFPERIAATQASAPALGGPFTLEQIEREHILRVMASAPTLDEAARILGIDALHAVAQAQEVRGGAELGGAQASALASPTDVC